MRAGSLRPLWQAVDRWLSQVTAVPPDDGPRRVFHAPATWCITRFLILATAACWSPRSGSCCADVGIGEVGYAACLGLATGARVIVLLVFSTLVWTPMGVAIGFSPKLARISQPIVQILASFPANFLFPFATLGFIKLGISLNWGSMLLMALGAQWYLLFNVIGGAQTIPNDLREMAASIGLRRSREWKTLIGPGIFGIVGHRRHHRFGRRLERQHRFRTRLLGKHDA